MTDLVKALGRGDPREVADLIARGDDVRYKRDHGYTALLDAVHGRDISRDPRLLALIDLLVAHGANLNGVSSYQEFKDVMEGRPGRRFRTETGMRRNPTSDRPTLHPPTSCPS